MPETFKISTKILDKLKVDSRYIEGALNAYQTTSDLFEAEYGSKPALGGSVGAVMAAISYHIRNPETNLDAIGDLLLEKQKSWESRGDAEKDYFGNFIVSNSIDDSVFVEREYKGPFGDVEAIIMTKDKPSQTMGMTREMREKLKEFGENSELIDFLPSVESIYHKDEWGIDEPMDVILNDKHYTIRFNFDIPTAVQVYLQTPNWKDKDVLVITQLYDFLGLDGFKDALNADMGLESFGSLYVTKNQKLQAKLEEMNRDLNGVANTYSLDHLVAFNKLGLKTLDSTKKTKILAASKNNSFLGQRGIFTIAQNYLSEKISGDCFELLSDKSESYFNVNMSYGPSSEFTYLDSGTGKMKEGKGRYGKDFDVSSFELTVPKSKILRRPSIKLDEGRINKVKSLYGGLIEQSKNRKYNSGFISFDEESLIKQVSNNFLKNKGTNASFDDAISYVLKGQYDLVV